jgi:hypothetical protein
MFKKNSLETLVRTCSICALNEDALAVLKGLVTVLYGV